MTEGGSEDGFGWLYNILVFVPLEKFTCLHLFSFFIAFWCMETCGQETSGGGRGQCQGLKLKVVALLKGPPTKRLL